MAVTQDDRTIRLEIPTLPANTLMARRVEGLERISDLFEFQLSLVSQTHDLKPEKLLGQRVIIHVELHDKKFRQIHGIVRRFSYGGVADQKINPLVDKFSFYEAEIVPWLWLLTRKTNCRIFQQKTIPQILNEIFGEWKKEFPELVQFNDRTNASNYRVHDYCVQYRESDFDFVSRIMQEEGIFYYFHHSVNGNTLVFGDTTDDHDGCPVTDQAKWVGDEDLDEDVDESVMQLVKSTAAGLSKAAAEAATTAALGLAGPVFGILEIIPGVGDIVSKIKKAAVDGIDSLLKNVREFLGIGTKAIEHGVKAWKDGKQVRSGKTLRRDYHFELPDKNLESPKTTLFPSNMNQKLELYDYPGEYAHRFNRPGERLGDVEKEGIQVVSRRMEEEEARHHEIDGISRQAVFTAGCFFELTGEHPRKDEVNGKYLLLEVKHTILQSPTFASVKESEDDQEIEAMRGVYRNRFICQPLKITYRPRRTTRKPIIAGLQTAKVVGKEKEEINVDKFGRVQVAFHWDREDDKKKHGKNACFVRVAQFWAGKRWGATFWPRIGQEVVVAFLEGDPDQPLIVGSVYNFAQMPPYLGDGLDREHPHNPRISGVKTCTTPDGAGFNEVRFDDTLDKEQVFIHAERDMDTVVWRDKKESVAHNRHLVVGGVDAQKKELVGDQFEAVANDKHQLVMRHHHEHIAGNMKLKIGGDREQYARSEHAGAFKRVPNNGNLSLVVTGGRMESIGGDEHLVVGQDHFEKIGRDHHAVIGGDQQASITGNHALEAQGEIYIKSGMSLVIEAGAQLSLKVGGNFIDINPAGVFIMGSIVMINSGGSPAVVAPCQAVEAKGAAEAKPQTPQVPDETENAASGFPSKDESPEEPRPKRPFSLAIKSP